MNTKPGRGSDQFMLRLPDGMRERIKATADANNRSMNAEIVATLEEKYPPDTYEAAKAELEATLAQYKATLQEITKCSDAIQGATSEEEQEFLKRRYAEMSATELVLYKKIANLFAKLRP